MAATYVLLQPFIPYVEMFVVLDRNSVKKSLVSIKWHMRYIFMSHLMFRDDAVML